MSIISDLREQYRTGGSAVRLMYVNIVVFVFVALLGLVGVDRYDMLSLLAMPMDATECLVRPWTVLTYMFVHQDIIHIIFNMLCLHWFGRLFSYLIDERLVLRTYLWGGVVGAVLCLVVFMGGSNGILLGASGAVLALLFAVAVYDPEYSVHIVFVGDIRLKYYALIFVGIDILSIAAYNNVGGHVAHLGGALYGAAMGLWWKRNGLPSFSKQTRVSIFGRKPKMKVEYGHRPLTDMEYNAERASRSHEVDRILEKIKQSGYNSLTAEERQTLFDESKK